MVLTSVIPLTCRKDMGVEHAAKLWVEVEHSAKVPYSIQLEHAAKLLKYSEKNRFMKRISGLYPEVGEVVTAV